MQHRWPPKEMAIKAIIRNCRSWRGRIMSNEEVACGVAIAVVHCFDWYQKCARKKQNPQKKVTSDNSKIRYQRKHSKKCFWGEADARRLQILFLILAHLCMRFGLLLLLQQQLLSREFSRFTNITYISHLRTEQRPEVHLNQKVFLMTYNDVASIEKYLCISFSH